ncbi:MAG: geranylgeranyl reductase family protein [Alphaproteobacteria bacterium]
MPKPVWDVIVVGAGPAGSSVAYDLAKAGKRVLVLDKAEFPRDKPCGGGLTPKTLKRLRFDVRAVVERECTQMVVSDRMEKVAALPDVGVVCSMVQRPAFDTFLLDKAVEAGAVFQVAEVEGVVHDCDSVVVNTNGGGTERCRWLIAADGAKSGVRRLVHKRPVVRQAFALEGKARLGEDFATYFDFFVVSWGYGWVFPKGDHLNVGIGTFNRNVKISRKDLMAYCKAKLGHEELHDVVGHPLGIGPANGRWSVGRVLFAGDAAGTVEALMGEGIHNAVCTGQVAAKAVVGGGPAWWVRGRYWLGLRRHWLDVRSCRNLALLFYRWPRVGYFILSRPAFLSRLARGFVRGWRLDRIVRGF